MIPCLHPSSNCCAEDSFDSIAALISSGDTAALERVFERRPDLLRVRDMGKHTPLHIAARAGRAEVVELLLTMGAEVDARMMEGATPLLLSAAQGDAQSVKQLLGKGADPNAATDEGERPLNEALLYGHAEVARQLVAGGA